MDPSTLDDLGDRLDHVARPRLPWRTGVRTECGRDADKFPTITSEDYTVRLRKYGQRRTAFTVCQTCAQRLTYDLRGSPLDPQRLVNVLAREVERTRWEPDSQLEHELQAIVALIEAHRDEFDATLAGLDDVTHISQRRAVQRARRIKR